MWLLVRAAIGPFAYVSGGHPVFMAPSAALLTLLMTGFFTWTRTRGLREDGILHNLGTGPTCIALLILAPLTFLEVLVWQLGTR